MRQRKLRFIKCECGNDVSARALARHLRGGRFTHSEDFKNNCIRMINWQKVDKQAWLISEGVNAKGDPYWGVKILNGELTMDQITFERPRPLGQNTPNALKKSSIDRKGKGNPSLVNKTVYNFEEIRVFATDAFENLGNISDRFSKLDQLLDETFPGYRYSFAGIFPEHNGKRGHNRKNMILSFLIDKPIEWLIEKKALDRGKLIQAGQRKSEKFDKMRSAGKGRLKSFISIPHYALYNMILSVDSEALMEKHIDCGKTWKSYDIFSPKINALIEMHGYVWHDWHKCKANLLPIVMTNVRNDVVKALLAEDTGHKLIIFWDDNTGEWATKIRELYGKEPKSYEQAYGEEIDKKGKR